MGILDSLITSVSSGITTAQSVFNDFAADSRTLDSLRARINGNDPTGSIDQSNGTNILCFPSDRPKYYITFAFEEYRRPSQFEGLSSSGLTDYICLPVPSNLKDNNQLNWNVEDGSFLVDAIAKTWNESSDAYKTGGINALKEMSGNITNDLGKTASGSSIQALNDIGGAAAKIVGADALFNGVKQIAGIADNPFSTVAFKGPNFKTHSFRWQMAAKTPNESTIIHKICETFKKVAYPEILSADTGGFYKYPMIVWPKFQPDDAMKALYKFKPCVISAVNIDKAPNDRPGFFAGTLAPVEVVLELYLTEIELWRNAGGQSSLLNFNFPTTNTGDFSDVQSPPVRNIGQI